MIKEIHFKNFKAYEDAAIKLRPITLLFGKNSSGKSSILKLMQLLKALADKRSIAGPLPTISDAHGLDLGHFHDYVYQHKNDRRIEIKLSCGPNPRDMIIMPPEHNAKLFYFNDGEKKSFDLFGSDEQIVKIAIAHSIEMPSGYIHSLTRCGPEDGVGFLPVKHVSDVDGERFVFELGRAISPSSHRYYLKNRINAIKGFEVFADYHAIKACDPSYEMLRSHAEKFGYDKCWNRSDTPTIDDLMVAGWVAGDKEAAKARSDAERLRRRVKTREQGLKDNQAAIEQSAGMIRESSGYKKALADLKDKHQDTLNFLQKEFSFQEFAEWSKHKLYATAYEYYEGSSLRPGRIVKMPSEDEFIACAKSRVQFVDDPIIDYRSVDYGLRCELETPLDSSDIDPLLEAGVLIAPDLGPAYEHLIIDECASIYSIGPSRNKPEHVYHAATSTNYVGFSGEHALSLLHKFPELLARTNKRLECLCGYKVHTQVVSQAASGYFTVSLRRSECDPVREDRFNDVGYGVSQLLPIIVQGETVEESIITIEQPELHIHPGLQAEFAQFLVESARRRDNTYLIESHSEHMVLRLQKLIRMKQVEHEDVGIYWVENTESGSTIRELPIDVDGEFLETWPNGFFPERMKEILG